MSRSDLAPILDTLIPADDALGMPSAAAVDFPAYANRWGAWPDIDTFLQRLDERSAEQMGRLFKDVAATDRAGVIDVVRRKDLRIFVAFLTHVFRAYYSSAGVLSRVDGGSIPPFPQGNVLPDEDWSILEPVFERGYTLR